MMTKTTVMIGLLLILGAGTWGYRASRAEDSVATPVLNKIGVVDISKVLSQCQEALDREKMIAEKRQKVRSELSKMAEEADMLRQELENVLKPGSKEYQDQFQKWVNKMALQEAYEKGQTQALAADTQAWTEVLYQKVESEIAKIARLENLSLVLDKDQVPAQARNPSELSALIRTRKVLFSAAGMDLTARVVENLDRAYDQEKAKRDKGEKQ